jgi:hypothetical protein
MVPPTPPPLPAAEAPADLAQIEIDRLLAG